MKVLIVGSTHNEPTKSTRDAFITACREIGAALARAKIEIVIGSASPNSADRYVLEGVASVEGRHKVWILRPNSRDTPLQHDIDEFGQRIEVVQKRLQGSWSAGRVPQ